MATQLNDASVAGEDAMAPMISRFFKPTDTGTGATAPLPELPVKAPSLPGGGVQELQVVRAPREVPEYKSVISAQGGPLELAPEDRERVVILDLGEQRCVLIWTNRPADEEPMRVATQRLRGQGFSIAKRYEASRDVIAVFYEAAGGWRDARDERDRERDQRLGESEMEARLTRIFEAAVAVNASDIHVRVRKDQPTSIDFRVNGDLELYEQITYGIGRQLTYAAFNYASSKTGVQFTEEEFQDARIQKTILVNGVETKINLRYASKPVHGGWDVVFRVLVEGDAGKYWALPKLGYDAAQIAAFDRMLSRPSGLIAIVGTTGSGKSRTLQTLLAMLYERYNGRKVIVTIEDPPEYYIVGASQVPVRRSTAAEGEDPENDSRAFGRALRACMRADPDVIMIGEVRDKASGRLCQEAVQTGHKVLTTLHASNPFEAMARFMDLGIERTILTGADFLTGIIYQRLAPIVCPNCAITIDEASESLSSAMLTRINKRAGEHLAALRFRGVGCNACRNTGIIGRTVAASILEPDLDILELVRVGERNRASLHWRTAAMGTADPKIMGRSALDHGIEKMLQGFVSPYDLETELGLMDGEITISQARQRMERSPTMGAAPIAMEGR